jgi:hypothetical protein
MAEAESVLEPNLYPLNDQQDAIMKLFFSDMKENNIMLPGKLIDYSTVLFKCEIEEIKSHPEKPTIIIVMYTLNKTFNIRKCKLNDGKTFNDIIIGSTVADINSIIKSIEIIDLNYNKTEINIKHNNDTILVINNIKIRFMNNQDMENFNLFLMCIRIFYYNGWNDELLEPSNKEKKIWTPQNTTFLTTLTLLSNIIKLRSGDDSSNFLQTCGKLDSDRNINNSNIPKFLSTGRFLSSPQPNLLYFESETVGVERIKEAIKRTERIELLDIPLANNCNMLSPIQCQVLQSIFNIYSAFLYSNVNSFYLIKDTKGHYKFYSIYKYDKKKRGQYLKYSDDDYMIFDTGHKTITNQYKNQLDPKIDSVDVVVITNVNTLEVELKITHHHINTSILPSILPRIFKSRGGSRKLSKKNKKKQKIKQKSKKAKNQTKKPNKKTKQKNQTKKPNKKTKQKNQTKKPKQKNQKKTNKKTKKKQTKKPKKNKQKNQTKKPENQKLK